MSYQIKPRYMKMAFTPLPYTIAASFSQQNRHLTCIVIVSSLLVAYRVTAMDNVTACAPIVAICPCNLKDRDLDGTLKAKRRTYKQSGRSFEQKYTGPSASIFSARV